LLPYFSSLSIFWLKVDCSSEPIKIREQKIDRNIDCVSWNILNIRKIDMIILAISCAIFSRFCFFMYASSLVLVSDSSLADIQWIGLLIVLDIFSPHLFHFDSVVVSI